MIKLKICRQAFTSSMSFHVVDWPRTPAKSCTKKNARAKRAKLLVRVLIAVEGVTA